MPKKALCIPTRRRAAFPNHLIPFRPDWDPIRRMPIHYKKEEERNWMDGALRKDLTDTHMVQSQCVQARLYRWWGKRELQVAFLFFFSLSSFFYGLTTDEEIPYFPHNDRSCKSLCKGKLFSGRREYIELILGYDVTRIVEFYFDLIKLSEWQNR